MKQSRLLIWFTLFLIALAVVLRFKHTRRAEPVVPAPATTAIHAPTPAPAPPSTPAEPIRLEDGMTVDFSSGQPVITRNDPATDAELRAALAEMEAATAGLILTSEGPVAEPNPAPPPPTEAATPTP